MSLASALGYAFLVPLEGSLGSFMTSTNLSSNILVSSRQRSAAAALGIREAITLGARTVGGATGNAVAPGDALVGATVVGRPEQVGHFRRRILPWSLGVTAPVASATLLLHLIG
ncbi:MAG: hypothetical protein HPY83_02170 [Anaerolineae bacterium]|nr:hypothetical protein [Anaerolineae bacterium]